MFNKLSKSIYNKIGAYKTRKILKDIKNGRYLTTHRECSLDDFCNTVKEIKVMP